MTISPEQLEKSGQLLYGDRWQSELSRSLEVDSRRIRQWYSKERPMPYWVYQKVTDLLRANKNLIEEYLTELDENMSQIDRVKFAKSIEELCDNLNEYEEDFDSELGKPTDFVDYSALPTFGDNTPDRTEEVFSWSDDKLLIKQNNWVLVDRTAK